MAEEINFKTRTRDEAIQASVVLADAIDSSKITPSRCVKILIIGGDGKSLIVDTLARHLSDDFSSDHIPNERFVETAPLSSTDRKDKKAIRFRGQDHIIALTHIFDDLSNILKPKKANIFSQFVNRFFKPTPESIYFVTTHHENNVNDAIKKGYFKPDIIIRFDEIKEDTWHRNWKLEVINQDVFSISKLSQLKTHPKAVPADKPACK